MIISVTALDSVACRAGSTPHALLLVAYVKDFCLFSANQTLHIKLCITKEGHNIGPVKNCNINHLSCVVIYVSRFGGHL